MEESTQDRGEPCAPRMGDFNPRTGKVYYGNGVWDFPPPTTTSVVCTLGDAGGAGTLGASGQVMSTGADGRGKWVDAPSQEETKFMRLDGTLVTQTEMLQERKAAARELLKDEIASSLVMHKFKVPDNVAFYNGMLMIGNIRWQMKMDPIGHQGLKQDGDAAIQWRRFIKKLLSGREGNVTDYGGGKFDFVVKFKRVPGNNNESSRFRMISMPEHDCKAMVEVVYQCSQELLDQQDHVAFCFDVNEPDVIRFDANFPGVLSVRINLPSTCDEVERKQFLLPPSADALKAYAGIIALVKGKKPYKATIDDTGHLVRTYDGDPKPASEEEPSNVMTLTEIVQQSGTSLAHDGRDTRVMVDGKRHRTLVVGPALKGQADQAESWSLFVQALREKARAWNCIDNEDVITYKWITDHKVPQTRPYSVLQMFFRDEHRGRDPMMNIQYNPSLSPVDDTQISHHTLWIEFDRDGKDTLSIESDFLGLAVIEFHVPLIQKAAEEPVKRADDAFDCHPNLLVVRRI